MLRATTAIALTLAAGLPAHALAQASYSEQFDDLGSIDWSVPGPQPLTARGWMFRNQSEPLGSHAYAAGTQPSTNPIYFNPQSGGGYLAVDGACTNTTSGGQMSAWAILPPVPNQIAGDTVTIWLRALGSAAGTLEVRYAPNGGTGTGSGAAAVGDFTQVLINASPVPSSGWTRFQATAPGNGRLALRYTGYRPGLGNPNPYAGIDSLSVGPPPAPPCNLPPIPQPGQSVTWTAANSPYRVCQDITIPVGGSVTIEPGVTVNIDSGRTVAVAGTVTGAGTASTPIVIAGSGNFPPAVTVPGGTLSIQFGRFHGQLRPLTRSRLILTDCQFPADGFIWSDGASSGLTGYVPGFVTLERCAFASGSSCTLADFLVQLRGTTFDNALAWFLRGYVDTTGGVTATGKAIVIDREEHQQPLLVDHVAASGVSAPFTNIAGPAGLALHGGNFLLGPSNTLVGNAYPIDLSGGILPGSVAPASGNATNAFYLSGAGGLSRLASVGIPYVLADTQYGDGARVTVDPGVRIAALPGSWMLGLSTGWLRLMGLPGAPITIEGVNGAQWEGVSFMHTGEAPHLEDCVIRHAEFGAQAVDTPALTIDSTLFEANSTGMNANTYGNIFLGKTRFVANATGASVTDTSGLTLLNFTNPNSFEGNTAAVNGLEPGSGSDANLVWWNSPSGPQHPQNPSGTGDPIVGPGAGGISIFPFLTTAPNFADHPPTVRMQAPGRDWWRVFVTPDFVFEPGQKYIVSWTASDDAGIVSQKILLNPDGGYPTGFQVLADNIPPGVRSWEITIPDISFAGASGQSFLRVAATDTAGQESFDQTACTISSGRITGNVTITSAPPSQTLIGGMQPAPDVTYSGSVNFGTAAKQIYLESDGQYDQGELGLLPFVSTDTARMVVYFYNNANDVKYVLGDGYFTIRPDPRLGILPPVVQVATPAQGAAYQGAVPITWTASAPEGLYAFDIQYSLDGGRYWRLLTEDLPAAARSYSWTLPPNLTASSTVRIRVIARDRRGQNSSSGADRSFSIAAGAAACYANCDASSTPPILNVQDFTCFLQKFSSGDTYANCDSSVTPPILNVQDFTCFLQKFAAGCP